MTGEEVNEQTVKQWSQDRTLAKYQVLHFATHGMAQLPYPNLNTPELAALVLSQFAAPRSEDGNEDNYLRVNEVAQLKLKADLVTLSACETGLGKVFSGQSVIGLTQSFLLAGANGLNVSLWKVSDEVTATLMTEVYKAAAAGQSYPEALTSVKRRFIAGEFGKKWQSPYYWSAFVYYGKE